MSITPLELFKQHIRIDFADHDAILQHYLDAAEDWIQDFIGASLASLNPFPPKLRQATMMLAAYWYENSEAIAAGVSMEAVPFGVLDAIRMHREWSFTDGD